MKIQLHAVSLVLLGLVLSVTLAVELREPNFLQVPEDRSQFLGREVVFQCSLDNVTLIPWTIKMVQLANSRPKMGLWYAISNINETAKNSNLTVLASSSFDMAPIFCTGIFYNDVIEKIRFKKSGVAVLRVQGVPDVITQFNGDNTSSTMILFEWTPPTHRRGLPPCCDSYYINITHFLSSESIVDDNVTSPSIEFSISEDRLCDVLLVSIVATNVVGDGAEFKQRWSLGGHFETRTANTSLMYTSAGALILDIRIEIRGYCLSDLSNVTFSLRCDDTPNDLVTTRLINALPNDRAHSTELNLTITDIHTERRCLWDVALDNDVDYNGLL
ncbi:PREDICTED: uncharacterized protein LOC109591142, partial [Amphimedon queenslandica]|uniref:Uncharacterized protein n=1 Tax=Amphimedon queenslandica TaxID=400682 RepID=A0AAN0JZG3_AMPQE